MLCAVDIRSHPACISSFWTVFALLPLACKFKMAALGFGLCTLLMIDGAPVFLHRGLSCCSRRLIHEFKMAVLGYPQ